MEKGLRYFTTPFKKKNIYIYRESLTKMYELQTFNWRRKSFFLCEKELQQSTLIREHVGSWCSRLPERHRIAMDEINTSGNEAETKPLSRWSNQVVSRFVRNPLSTRQLYMAQPCRSSLFGAKGIVRELVTPSSLCFSQLFKHTKYSHAAARKHPKNSDRRWIPFVVRIQKKQSSAVHASSGRCSE